MTERKGFTEGVESFDLFRERVRDRLLGCSDAEGFGIPLAEAHLWPYPVVVAEGGTADELPDPDGVVSERRTSP